MNSVQSPSRKKTVYHRALHEYVNKNTYKRIKNLTQIASRKETADLGSEMGGRAASTPLH